MENLGTVLSEIVQETTAIETKYQELYKFLEQNLITLTAVSNMHLDREMFQDYLQRLKQLLMTYIKNHKL